MVSKIIKKTPTKSIKDCRSNNSRRNRRKSPLKIAFIGGSTSAAVFASINKSILSCHRRLLKIFSTLAPIPIPTARSKSCSGYKILSKTFDPEPERQSMPDLLPDQCSVLRPLKFESYKLPPLTSQEKRTIILDLDETLVHSRAEPPTHRFDFVVKPVIDGQLMTFYVLKRPGVDEFLETLSAKFEIVIFTAGLREYASLVVDRLDRKRLISHRLYRDSCKDVDGRLVKDLSDLGRDLKRVVIVDDNPNSYSLQPENAIPIESFIDNLKDRELSKLVPFLDGLDCFEDMRDAVKNYLPHDHNNLETLQF